MMHNVEIKRHERKHNNMMETKLKNEAKKIWEAQMKVAYRNGRKDERKECL